MRKHIFIRGIVQGVGFRPFVYRQALRYKVTGFVYNNSEGVICEAQGQNVEQFVKAIKTGKPKVSEITQFTVTDIDDQNETDFKIILSVPSQISNPVIPADIATCNNCKEDIKSYRRKNYSFTNCTNCGPRYTIVEKLPYDRKFTSMHKFNMCKECSAEYNNPENRRFHAEPNACDICGPQPFIETQGKKFEGFFAIKEASRLLANGNILAVKGIGGFHLACDALNLDAVKLLRQRKARPLKPFALMCADIGDAKELCYVTKAEEKALLSPAAPIVMLKKKRDIKGVSDGLNTIGIMLAYSPLHLLLFSEFNNLSGKKFLVMTSGNRADEPICVDNAKALSNLKGIADYFLLHNRDIINRCDDSVICFEEEQPVFIRRSRGYVPNPVKVDENGDAVFAVGADMKNVFCLAKGGNAVLSPYIGDMDERLTQNYFMESLNNFKRFLDVEPKIIACDSHPQYYSSAMAKNLEGRKIYVQHHHAHLASVMAEHNLKEPVLGVTFDGTGYGEDGGVWGGEFFYYNLDNFERMASLKPMLLAGGDNAVKEIFRPALGYYYGADLLNEDVTAKIFGDADKEKFNIVLNMLKAGFNCVKCSSMGRLFDAVSFAGKVLTDAKYDAHAPMLLESLFENPSATPFKFDITAENGFIYADPAPVFKEIAQNNFSPKEVSEKFHTALSDMTCGIINKLSNETGVKTVVFSGGVFNNRALIRLIKNSLKKHKLYFNEKVPCGDGGIALGQVYIALKQLAKDG